MHRASILPGIALIGLLLGGAIAPSSLYAQDYPNRPIRIFTQFAPGGAVEVTLRVLADALGGAGWPPVVVENRPGGGGTLAGLEVKRAAPDGYTLLLADIGSHAVSPNLVPDPPYDPVKDFTPITLLWSFSSTLAVPAASPAKSVADLVAMAKMKAGGLNYASQGPGSGGQLLGAMFAKAVGTPMTHVPYKGAGPAILDLIGNRVEMMFASYGSVKGAVDSGRLRLLAVTSRSRLAELPDVPTMGEAGYPEVFLDAWFGLAGPAGLPEAVVSTLHDRVVAVLHSDAMLEKLRQQAWNVTTSTPQQFRELIATDVVRLGKVLKDAGIQ
jgi:tripartite-type tricarboxylate transporter receptor subunit TctC